MRQYTVYCHTSPSGKRYIGITSTDVSYRWRGGLGGYSHNAHFLRAIKQYGWENFNHEIICCGLTREEAEQKEIELIKQFNTTDKRYGYNLDNGGNGVGKHSANTINKIKQAVRGKAVGEKNPNYGRTGCKNVLSKTVIRIDAQNGEEIDVFAGMMDACRATGIPHESICRCCKGKQKTAGGYIWKYRDGS